MTQRPFDLLHLQRDDDSLLKSKCLLARAYPMPLPTKPPNREFQALWDTGSNGCMVSAKVVKLCGLRQEGEMDVNHVAGKSENRPFYYVELTLPNGARFSPLLAVLTDGKGYDFLIGMNIISQGDLLVLNGGIGEAPATFRYPAVNDGGHGMIPQENASRQSRRGRRKRP